MRRRLFLLAPLAAALASPALAGKAEKKKGGGESFIQMPTMTATAIRPDGRRGVLTVEAGVDAPDPAVRETAERALPRLRAAYAQILRTYAAALRPGFAPDADRLSAQLQRATDQTLGRKGARLLLGTVMVR
ncbi:MAG TPA: Tat pathway signal protein [Caulobacteraceae bacterium]|nr:Tat pathway signal protein [Caulobacteraceae bacterium]